MTTTPKFPDFLFAQDEVYATVLRELSTGRKQTHWIWFIFPQIAGLGSSAMSQKFALNSKSEARSYLAHPILGPRLRECAQLTLNLPNRKIHTVMGYPDDLKFKSSMTLFALAAPEETIFEAALKKYFRGERCEFTAKQLGL